MENLRGSGDHWQEVAGPAGDRLERPGCREPTAVLENHALDLAARLSTHPQQAGRRFLSSDDRRQAVANAQAERVEQAPRDEAGQILGPGRGLLVLAALVDR